MHIQAPNFLTSAASDADFEHTTMGYENELCRDGDGEPVGNFGENVGSERNEPQQRVLDVACSKLSQGSPTPMYNETNSKSRKLIVKIKSARESGPVPTPVCNEPTSKCGKLLIKLKTGRESGPTHFGLDGKDVSRLRDENSGGKKRKEDKGQNRRSLGKKKTVEKGERKSRAKKSRKRGMEDHDEDSEIKEMWDTVAGGNTEDDQNGVKTVDNGNIIDNSGVDPSYCYGSDKEHSPSRDIQAKEGKVDDEIEELFKIGKRKKKKTDPAATVLLVENVVAELEAVAEEDAELNRQKKPAITKLRNLSLLTDIIPRKHLQQEFLHRGVLKALRLWLEPLPDGSVPNINVRAAVFKCLNDLSIDLELEDHRQRMTESHIGKAVMYYSKWNDETTANRKLAKELVEKWSRAVFENSTTYEGMNNYEVKRTYKRPPVKKAMSNAAAGASRNDDLDLSELSLGLKSGPSSSRQHASRPEAMSMDFVVRPPSKVDPEAVRGQAKRMVQGQRRAQLNKKLERMKAPKRKQLQAVKLSAEGRGMAKYF